MRSHPGRVVVIRGGVQERAIRMAGMVQASGPNDRRKHR